MTIMSYPQVLIKYAQKVCLHYLYPLLVIVSFLVISQTLELIANLLTVMYLIII